MTETSPPHRFHVLVAYTDPVEGAKLERRMLHAGHRVTRASSPRAVARALGRGHIDLTVLATSGPLESVLEFLRAARDEERDSFDAPVLLADALQRPDDVTRTLLRADATGILPQSCDAASLRQFLPRLEEPTVGTRAFLGRYNLEAPIAMGRTATVLRALDTESGQSCAVKVIDQTQHRRAYASREARALRCLSHPTITALLDARLVMGDTPVLVTPFREGTTLDVSLEHRAIPARMAIGVVTDVARGLEAAHAQGIVHRDVKPSNIIVSGLGGRTTLLDFGCAYFMDLDTPESGFVGSALYAPPEQLMGKAVEPAADVYALGATLFHLLSGAPPFSGSYPGALLAQHLKAPVPSLAGKLDDHRVDLGALDALISAVMAKRPQERLVRLDEIIERLTATRLD